MADLFGIPVLCFTLAPLCVPGGHKPALHHEAAGGATAAASSLVSHVEQGQPIMSAAALPSGPNAAPAPPPVNTLVQADPIPPLWGNNPAAIVEPFQLVAAGDGGYPAVQLL